MKLDEIKKKLCASTVSKNKRKNFVARFGFYYKMGKNAVMMRDRVQEIFPNANIVDYGEKYTSFRGGAPVHLQSHWYVEFNFKEQ